MKPILIIALLFLFATGTAFANDTDPKAKKATPPVTTEKAKTVKPKKVRHKIKGIQCEGMTGKGTQCTRSAQDGSKFCWQHDPKGKNGGKKSPAIPKKS